MKNSAAADKGDDLNSVIVLQSVLSVVLFGNEILVDLNGAGLLREPFEFEQARDCQPFGRKLSGLSVDDQLHPDMVGVLPPGVLTWKADRFRHAESRFCEAGGW